MKLLELPGRQLIDLPDVVQPNDYFCWACVCTSIARFWGIGPRTCHEWASLLKTTRKNPGEPQMVYDAFKNLKCQVAQGEGLTIDNLRHWWHEGWPVVCPIQEYMSGGEKAKGSYGHCVAVIGADLGMVFVQDPSEDNVVRPEKNDSDNSPGRAMIDEKKWMDVWHDREWKHCGVAIGPPPGRRNFGDLS